MNIIETLTDSSQNILTEQAETSRCGRFCKHWRSIAGITSLILSIIGIVGSVMLNVGGLAIIYGVIACASCYLIYLGYQFHHLKTFEESNSALQERIDILEGQLEDLDRTTEEYKAQNQELQRSCENLGELTDKLRQSGKKSEDTVDHLQSEIEVLKELNKSMEQTALARLREMNKLNASLEELNISFEGNNDDLGVHVQQFSTVLSKIQASCNDLTGASDNTEKLLSSQLKALSEIGTFIKGAFDDFVLIKNDPAYESRLNALESLKNNLHNVQIDLANTEGQLQQLVPEVERLKETRKLLDQGVNRFTGEVKRLSQENNQFRKTAEFIVKHVSPQKKR